MLGLDADYMSKLVMNTAIDSLRAIREILGCCLAALKHRV
jgi:hypothetical protein